MHGHDIVLAILHPKINYAGGNDAPNTVAMKLCTASMMMNNIESEPDDKTCSSPANDTCSAAKIEQLDQDYQTFMRDENFEKFCEMVGAL